MLPHTAPEEPTNMPRGRRPQGEYLVNITVGLDITCLERCEEGIQLTDRATVPPMLQAYAEQNGHRMPDGFYGFYGESAEQHLFRQLDYSLAEFGGDRPIWDLTTTLHFQWADPDNRPKAAAMAWKDPHEIQGAFLRIGRVSGETNDLLRFYAGDRLAVDRLTLEPWRIDAYTAALEQVYGPIRGVLFDAMMVDGSIQTIVKVYDRTLLESPKLSPLYRWLSARDPNQPPFFLAPSEDWSGWSYSSRLLTEIDMADIMTFITHYRQGDKSRAGKRMREVLNLRRIRYLREEGRFLPRDKEIKEVARRRKQATSHHQSRKVEAPGAPIGSLSPEPIAQPKVTSC